MSQPLSARSCRRSMLWLGAWLALSWGPLACGSDSSDAQEEEPLGYLEDCADDGDCEGDLICGAPWGPRERCTLACERDGECPRKSFCTEQGHCTRRFFLASEAASGTE